MKISESNFNCNGIDSSEPYIPGCKYVGELEWDDGGAPIMDPLNICVQVFHHPSEGLVISYDGEEVGFNKIKRSPRSKYYVFEYDEEG